MNSRIILIFSLFFGMSIGISSEPIEVMAPSQGIVYLSGVWEVFPGKLLSPDEIDKHDSIKRSLEANHWFKDEMSIQSPEGVCTYRNFLKIPGNDLYALRLGIIYTSYKAFLNGHLIGQAGNPGITKSESVESYSNVILPIQPEFFENGKAELIVQISNWSDSNGGFTSIPRFGTINELELVNTRDSVINIIFLGICLAIGLYHLTRFLFYRKELSYLFFGLICLGLGLRILSTGNLLILLLFPEMSYGTIYFLNYLSFTLLTVFFMAFFASFYERKWHTFTAYLIGILGIAFIVFILITEPYIYKHYLMIWQIITILGSIICFIILISALRAKKTGSVILLTGFAILFISAVNDIIAQFFNIALPELSLYGLVIFIFAQAIVLAYQHARLVSITSSLSRKLQELNKAQARFVPNEILQELNSSSLLELEIGESTELKIVVVKLLYDIELFEDDLKKRLTFVNGIHREIGPLVRSHGGYMYRYGSKGATIFFSGGIHKAIEAVQDIIVQGDLGSLAFGERVIIRAGLDSGPTRIGIVGESERCNIDLITEREVFCQKLTEMGAKFGTRLVVSKAGYNAIQEREKFQYRPIGSIHFNDTTEVAYDFFDADPSDIWTKKRATKRALNRGLRAQALGNIDEARQILYGLLNTWPEDPVIKYHLEKIG